MITFYLFAIFAGTIHLCQNVSVRERSIFLVDNLQINVSNRKIQFNLTNLENDAELMGEFGVLLPDDLKSLYVHNDENSLSFGDNLKLRIEKKDQCYHINWTSSENLTLSDCFFYDKDNWYGGPQSFHQYWPFNNFTFKDFSYVTKVEGNQAIAEPYWVTSSGYYVYVNNTTPLFIDANNFYNNSLCLIAKQAYPYLPRGGTTLAYKVCAYKNVREAHMKAVKAELGHPTDIPDRRMIEHPIWSTWVRYKIDVNESAVRNFAKLIVDHGFNNSQMEIDDKWETCYGNSKFNKSRFPNMQELASDLKQMGFRVTIWDHPFVNTNCDIFQILKDKGYLIKNQKGEYNTTWWDGIGGVIDFTNPDAANWFLEDRLALMKANNIDCIKMDAGEGGWLPQIPQLHVPVDEQPNAFTNSYVTTVSQIGSMVEVRSGYRSQTLPIFVRMIDRDSRWGLNNGLASVITTVFQMNLSGYTLVLPDMIGGNAYNNDRLTKEMIIRWLQVNTFMPSIQFSLAPFDFDNETVEICKKFTALHYEYSDKIIKQMQECVKTGAPVNTPIWWVDPTDHTAHSVWSEYMLGEDILVAPVVVKGAVTRDIYLPKGRWRAESDSNRTVYQGRQWLHNYPAPLDTLPFFIRHQKH